MSSAVPPDARRTTARCDEKRLARLLGDHFDAVWRAIRRFGVPDEGVDDAAQEVFIVAARKLEIIEVGRELPFLYGIALRVAANARRARATRRERPDESALLAAASKVPAADELLEEKRMRELLDVVLNQLSYDLRTVFVLFELEGLSAPEIAEAIQIPVGTVASRLRRARQAFQEAAERTRGAIESGAKP